MPTLSAIASQHLRRFNFIALNIDDVFTALIEYMAHIGWRPPFSNLMLVLDDGPCTLYTGIMCIEDGKGISNMVYRRKVGAEIGVCVGVGLGGV